MVGGGGVKTQRFQNIAMCHIKSKETNFKSSNCCAPGLNMMTRASLRGGGGGVE